MIWFTGYNPTSGRAKAGTHGRKLTGLFSLICSGAFQTQPGSLPTVDWVFLSQ